MIQIAGTSAEIMQSESERTTLSLCKRIHQAYSDINGSHAPGTALDKGKGKMVSGSPSNGSRAWTAFHKEKCLDLTEDVSKRHWYRRKFDAMHASPKGRIPYILKDVSTMATSLPEGIFVKASSELPGVMKALIVGPDDTPSEGALFEFDIFAGEHYPDKPPKVWFLGFHDGRADMNPNLHADGQVCLSLLGIWHGPPESKWQAKRSTIMSVLVSIHALILNDEPWRNEPGCGEDMSPRANKLSQVYNRRKTALTVRFAMLPWLRDRSWREGVWGEVVRCHFQYNGVKILKTVRRWARECPAIESFHESMMSVQSDPYRRGRTNCLRELERALKNFRCLDDALPDRYINGLQHLRRFVKLAYLPAHLQKVFTEERSVSEDEGALQSTLVMLVAPTSVVSFPDLLNLLSHSPVFSDEQQPSQPVVIPVPRSAPTSAAQATRWTTRYWPSVYKQSNPFGPHPSIWSQAGASLDPARWMGVAFQVAGASRQHRLGEAVGAVVVEPPPSSDRQPAVLVAGDARWSGLPHAPRLPTDRSKNGNVMAHATMRAIGLVARRRRAETGWASSLQGPSGSIFQDIPLTPVEEGYYDAATLVPGRYLCLDLDIYLTHEPCVMCCMALAHSRFGRVVIASRMPLTGGLTCETVTSKQEHEPEEAEPEQGQEHDPGEAEEAEAGEKERQRAPGLGYGLFHRRELNWRMLAWEWTDGQRSHDVLPLHA
ncbi:MAG: hypothetical protein M1838_001533 [Thelocarpon superellum]|nr:MAG: hypothetical protein M1838_001533 [Thelocarpon superellum]